jgi:hypothetical protein
MRAARRDGRVSRSEREKIDAEAASRYIKQSVEIDHYPDTDLCPTWLLAIFCSMIITLIALFGRGAASAQTAPPVACFNNHCDTELDISHADITARLVGCNVRKDDRVLVNGKRQDGIIWSLYSVVPARVKPVEPAFESLMAGMQKPMTLPEVSFRLKPAYYSGLKLMVGACSFGPFPLATTASGDRDLLLVEGRGTAATGAGGVYGYMPLPGLQIVLRGTSEETLVARDEIAPSPFGDKYMFYFDAVKPGRYTLIVYGVGWEKSLGEVVVDKPGEMVLRYIHDSEVGL